MDKPKIQYPCPWSYKVIGNDKDIMMDSIGNLLDGLDYKLDESRQSSRGKFVSLELNIEVQNEEERLRIFEILKNIPTVKMVL